MSTRYYVRITNLFIQLVLIVLLLRSVDFLPSDKYFRLNNKLTENLGNMAIDEKNKSTLSELKRLAEKTWVEIDSGPDAKRFEMLVKTLRGPSPK